MTMFGIGLPELLLILVIALVIFGPGKLPSVGQAMGKTINEFKKAMQEKNTASASEEKETDTKAVTDKKNGKE